MVTQLRSYKAKIQRLFIASLAISPFFLYSAEFTGKPILAEDCGMFFVEEAGLGESKYLQAFELEEGNENELVQKPIGVNRSVAISKQSVTTMNAYQYSQMVTKTDDVIRAKRGSFLSVFPENKSEDQIAMISSLCPDLDELDEALAMLVQTDKPFLWFRLDFPSYNLENF